MVSDSSYWNQYYSLNHSHRLIPSQFGVFVAGEFLDKTVNILDLGCGDGRDLRFFHDHGFSAIGIDSAQMSVGDVLAQATPEIIRGDITDVRTISKSLEKFEERTAPTLMYARFLLHALKDSELESFLQSCGECCKPGDFLAFEYRTPEDDFLPKTTETHFRRGVDSSWLTGRLKVLGFEAQYSREGFGFAKYKSDDAHVARQVFLKK